MKVNYLQKNRLGHPYLRRILLLVAIFAFGAFILSFLDEAILSAVSPIWKAENIVTRNLQSAANFFGSRKALLEENAVLKEKLSSLEMKILSMSGGQSQENMFRELAGRRQESDAMVAAVLIRPPQTPYDVIIIDAGSDESVTIGSEVFLPEGPLLGMVFEVFPKTAKVKLFSASGEKTNAILERNNVPVTITGNGGGNFSINLARGVDIEIEDRILSSDISARLLAVVEDISVRPTDSFKEALAKSPVNIFNLRFVFVAP